MTESSRVSQQKEEFYNKLNAYYEVKPGKKVFSNKQQQAIIKEIQTAKMKGGSKTRREYFLLQIYGVWSNGNKDFLIKKISKGEAIKFVVSFEDLYDRLCDIHVSTGHGGHLKMRRALSSKFSIPRPAIKHFLETCESCNKKKDASRKAVVRPITSKEFNERGQIDLIDFQSLPDGPYRWIMNYQDHATKFISLRPLKSTTATEVAKELLHIFLTFGAPKILQSYNEREFVHQIIRELKELWPECVIANGRPRQHQNEENVDRCSQDVEDRLKSWMAEKNSKQWSIGIQFVQWQKNISYNDIIDRSPYRALFGGEAHYLDLVSSKTPDASLNTLQNEEDLEIVEFKVETESFDSKYELPLTANSLGSADSIVEKFENIDDTPNFDSESSNQSSEISDQFFAREDMVKDESNKTRIGQKRSAEEMLSSFTSKREKFCKDDCVLVSVPKVDQEPENSSIIVAVVVDTQNGVKLQPNME